MSSVRAVRDGDFVDVVLGAAAPVAVGCADSWPDSASPMGDLLDRLARDNGWLVVARLDTTRSPRTATAYRVQDGPAVLLFDAGRILATLSGVPAESDVTRAFERPAAIEHA